MMGIYFSLASPLYPILSFLFLLTPFLIIFFLLRSREYLKSLILIFLLFSIGSIYVSSHTTFPSLPPEGLQGLAHVKINNLSLQTTPFGKNWIYRCQINDFFPIQQEESITSFLPCTIVWPKKERKTPHPTADKEYWVAGKLKQLPNGNYILKVSSKTTWEGIPNTWSFAELRYHWKKNVSYWITSRYSISSSGSFLAGLLTGEFDDYWMKQQFGRFGLQHLLAISGFHFAIIASFLSILFRLFFPRNLCIIALLLCLGFYCFFLGPQPSILRAWIMCSLGLLGGLLEKQSISLNSLGVALLLILSYNPLLCQELGFQLSFAITAAILLFYSEVQTFCIYLFPKRTLSHTLEMNGLNQHAYCLLVFLRDAVALTLAVSLFAFPLTLYYFQQFPWMSLLYNLFFPLLASFSLCFLLMGGILSFLPFIAKWIHHFNNEYTYFLLQLTYQIPAELDAQMRIESLPTLWMILYLCIVCTGGIILKERGQIHDQDEKSLPFI